LERSFFDILTSEINGSGDEMVAVDRLISAGMEPEAAVDTALWFKMQGDEDGLENFVAEIERRGCTGRDS
jgi:hypothetical protein